jgi:hypothetical protein
MIGGVAYRAELGDLYLGSGCCCKKAQPVAGMLLSGLGGSTVVGVGFFCFLFFCVECVPTYDLKGCVYT